MTGAPWSEGPWFFEEAETRKRQYIVRCRAGLANGGRGMVVADKIELDHDARLIAAAPELYEHLEHLTKLFVGMGVWLADIQKAERVLAKARGGQ